MPSHENERQYEASENANSSWKLEKRLKNGSEVPKRTFLALSLAWLF